jgi:hypothetical protein
MANTPKPASEKKAVPVNILLTEDANLALSQFALQVSTAAARVSKSDIVRVTLQAGLPLIDRLHRAVPDLPLAQLPDLLTREPITEALDKLAQDHIALARTRGAVRTRGGVRTGGGRGETGAASTAPAAGPVAGITLLSPVNTGVHQPPTLRWQLSAELIAAHLWTHTLEPLRCRVQVYDDAQVVWDEVVEVALPPGADPAQEAQRVHTLALPPDRFAQLAPLTWKQWRVQVTSGAGAHRQEDAATALFLKVLPEQVTRATVEGLLGQGRAHEAQGLLEESAAFFQQALETSCQQLIELYRRRGLPQAEMYEQVFAAIPRLNQ